MQLAAVTLGLKGHVSLVEADLAKERTEVKRLETRLTSALDENEKLKAIVARYQGHHPNGRREKMLIFRAVFLPCSTLFSYSQMGGRLRTFGMA